MGKKKHAERHSAWKAKIATNKEQMRKLGADLGGYIFLCDHTTEQKCLDELYFGAGNSHWDSVETITAGMPIYLFNTSRRVKLGPFLAITAGEKMLKEDLFLPPKVTGSHYTEPDDKTSYTKFPAQVKVATNGNTAQVPEGDIRGFVTYQPDNHTIFSELDAGQATSLALIFQHNQQA